jgi:PQQ-dependent catabolism-associated CXXCW motif protein
MVSRIWFRAALLLLLVGCAGQLAGFLSANGLVFAQGAAGFGDEDRDWGVAPPPGLRGSNYHGRTPTTIPGARVVKTLELKTMLESDPRPFLVDVLSGPAHRTLPGALWLHNGGLGDFDAAEEKRYLDTIALLAGHDTSRHLVFFCSSARCWLSYNAASRALYQRLLVPWRNRGLARGGAADDGIRSFSLVNRC